MLGEATKPLKNKHGKAIIINTTEFKDISHMVPSRLDSTTDSESYRNGFNDITISPLSEKWPFDEPYVVPDTKDKFEGFPHNSKGKRSSRSNDLIQETDSTKKLGNSNSFEAKWDDFFGLSDRAAPFSASTKIKNRFNSRDTNVRLGSYLDANNEIFKNNLNSRSKSSSSDQSFTTQNSGTSSQVSGSNLNTGGVTPVMVGSNAGGSSNMDDSSNTGDFSNDGSIPGSSGNGAFRPDRKSVV